MSGTAEPEKMPAAAPSRVREPMSDAPLDVWYQTGKYGPVEARAARP